MGRPNKDAFRMRKRRLLETENDKWKRLEKIRKKTLDCLSAPLSAIEIIKRIGNTNLKLQLDIFHLQHICGDLSHNIKNLMPHVGHVQIAQVPSPNEPNTDGEINYKYILQHLENNGYSDWICLEYKPAGNTKDGLNWIQEFGYTLWPIIKENSFF